MKDENWRARLGGLDAIDWSKSNKDWENVCIIANSVVSNRQARAATKAYIKAKLEMELTESERRSEERGGLRNLRNAAYWRPRKGPLFSILCFALCARSCASDRRCGQAAARAGVNPDHCPTFGTRELQENGLCVLRRRIRSLRQPPSYTTVRFTPERWGNRPALLWIAKDLGRLMVKRRSVDAASSIRRRSAAWNILRDPARRSASRAWRPRFGIMPAQIGDLAGVANGSDDVPRRSA